MTRPGFLLLAAQATAFVAGNKTYAGGIRLLHSGVWRDIAPADIEYRYEISCPAAQTLGEPKSAPLMIAAYDVSCDYNSGRWTETIMFSGTLEQFGLWVKAQAKQEAV